MDTIAGLPQAVEAAFADAIGARDAALDAAASAVGALGPPDLCWLQRGRGAWQPGADPATAGAGGYYHSVLGAEAASGGAVSAYYARVAARLERPGTLQRFFQGDALDVQRVFYCAYDAISQRDMRCEICIPGGLVCGLVDADGSLHDADQLAWQQVQVCAFIRAVLYDPEMLLSAGPLDVLPAAATPAEEARLLGSVLALYTAGVLPGGLVHVAAAQGYGALPEHADIALYAVWHHLRSRQRWTAATTFFSRLSRVHPPAAVWQAAALRAAGRSEGITQLLGGALEAAPESPALLVAMATECLKLQQVDTAGRLARQAVALNWRCRPAWLLLARCYSAEGLYAEALVALNALPTPPLPRDERELLFVVPPPPPARVTTPQQLVYAADLEAARALALEDDDTGGGASRLLAYLPGAVLLNKDPPEAGPWPDCSPNRITRAVLAAVYSELQQMVNILGWDGFLSVRSRVFVMHGAAAKAAGKQAAGADAQAIMAGRSQQQASSAAAHKQQPSVSRVEQGEGRRSAPPTPQQAPGKPAAYGNGQELASTQQPGAAPAATPSSQRNSTAGSAKGEGPAAFYASRVHTALGGPATGEQPQDSAANGAAGPEMLAAGGAALASQLTGTPAVAPAPAAPATAAAPLFEPMAGRVLLLGRRTRRLTPVDQLQHSGSPGGRHLGSSSGSARPSSSLAARPGVEKLSRLSGASVVAGLPVGESLHSGAGGEGLWKGVLGAGGREAGGTGATAVPGGLAPIRTRQDAGAPGPLGEAHESAPGQPAPEGQQPGRQLHPAAPLAPNAHGLLRAGSLLLGAARAQSGTPSSAAPAAAAAVGRDPMLRAGVLASLGSGPVSPGFMARHSAGGAAPQLRSLGLDRDAIAHARRLVQPDAAAGQHADGEACSTAAADAPGLLLWEGDGDADSAAGMRLCVRWLDELVVALWHDLTAFLEWRVLDQSLREAQGMTHAELVLSAAAGSKDAAAAAAAAAARGDATGPTPPQLAAVDWARRGFLAERLGHTHVARSAYRVAIALGFSLSAYTALLRLEAGAGATADTLLAAGQLLAWHEARAAAVMGATTSGVQAGGGAGDSHTCLSALPAPVVTFLGDLAAGVGVARVTDALRDEADTPHPLLAPAVAAWALQQERDAEPGGGADCSVDGGSAVVTDGGGGGGGPR